MLGYAMVWKCMILNYKVLYGIVRYCKVHLPEQGDGACLRVPEEVRRGQGGDVPPLLHQQLDRDGQTWGLGRKWTCPAAGQGGQTWGLGCKWTILTGLVRIQTHVIIRQILGIYVQLINI